MAGFSVSTVLRGASEAGHMVGYQVVAGQITPFVALPGVGLQALPLPGGYVSGFGNDANAAGVVVGAVAQNGFPFDAGEPAIWTPDGMGGYDVTIPQQFGALPSPLGLLSINGGQAVSVNENGVIVGWSRYQGFQGGPSTRFFTNGTPVDLSALGFAATVTDLSDTTDLIVGGDLRMDLTNNVVTPLGLPGPLQPGNQNFVDTSAYAVNDSGESVVAARLATSLPNKYLTFLHDDINGFTQLNPGIIPSVFVGFYDNNNLGDVSASGGVYFAAEDVLVSGFDTLLTPTSSNWDTSLGFIADDRRVYTTAFDAQANTNALVVLVPEIAASTTVRNGSGVNALAFTELSPPVIGTNWQTQVDLAGAGGQVSFVAVAVSPPVTVGLPMGELLVQTPYLELSTASGVHSLAIPANASLAGRQVQTQGASWEPGQIRLFNALDLVLGF